MCLVRASSLLPSRSCRAHHATKDILCNTRLGRTVGVGAKCASGRRQEQGQVVLRHLPRHHCSWRTRCAFFMCASFSLHVCAEMDVGLHSRQQRCQVPSVQFRSDTDHINAAGQQWSACSRVVTGYQRRYYNAGTAAFRVTAVTTVTVQDFLHARRSKSFVVLVCAASAVVSCQGMHPTDEHSW